MYPPAPIFYFIFPFINGRGGLPTPSSFNGVPDTEWPKTILIPFYVQYSAVAFIMLFYVLADDLFFIMNVLICSKRFETISEILQLLNYEGQRDRQKDQRILRDSYLMHLEVIE